MSYTYTGTLEIVECAHCHMDFGITPDFKAERKGDHESFYCPAGHSQHYPQETREERLKKRLAQETHCCEQNKARVCELQSEIERERARVAGYKGYAAKLKRQMEPTE